MKKTKLIFSLVFVLALVSFVAIGFDPITQEQNNVQSATSTLNFDDIPAVTADLPANITLNIADQEVFSQLGSFNDSQIINFTTELEEYLATCTPDGNGDCEVPVELLRSATGKITISDISITYLSEGACFTDVECDDNITCTTESCNLETNVCEYQVNDSICDDSLFCNGVEQCTLNGCISNNPINCSTYDNDAISTCDYLDDNNTYTLDIYPEFNSTCDENLDSCSSEQIILTHTCDITECLAECEESSDCTDKCERAVSYMSGSCNFGCVCEYSIIENCSLNDGWYNTSQVRNYSISQYYLQEQYEQEDRLYGCNLALCNYTISNTKWMNTSNIYFVNPSEQEYVKFRTSSLDYDIGGNAVAYTPDCGSQLIAYGRTNGACPEFNCNTNTEQFLVPDSTGQAKFWDRGNGEDVCVCFGQSLPRRFNINDEDASNVNTSLTSINSTKELTCNTSSDLTIKLNKGWNLVSFNLNQNNNVSANLSLDLGWNLIGYSNNQPFTFTNSEFTNGSTIKTQSESVDAGWLQNMIYYYDGNYKFVPGNQDNLLVNKGYWVYANTDLQLRITGTETQSGTIKYNWTGMQVTNGATMKTVEEAHNSGWLQSTIYYYNETTNMYNNVPGNQDYISSWRGYWIYTFVDNISIIIPQPPPGPHPG